MVKMYVLNLPFTRLCVVAMNSKKWDRMPPSCLRVGRKRVPTTRAASGPMDRACNPGSARALCHKLQKVGAKQFDSGFIDGTEVDGRQLRVPAAAVLVRAVFLDQGAKVDGQIRGAQ